MAVGRRRLKAARGVAVDREQRPVRSRNARRRVLGQYAARATTHEGCAWPHQGVRSDHPERRPALVRVLTCRWTGGVSALRFHIEFDDAEASPRHADTE